MQLRDHEIHVFAAPIAVTIPEQWYAALSADERERGARFLRPMHQQRFITARAILRQLLGQYLNVDPAVIQFSFGEHDKPALAGPHANSLQFNLSHSDDMAVYAFTRSGAIGIDIEKIQSENKSDIAERFFSPAEIAALATLAPSEQAAGFFRLWSRKEAIIKANGKGLAQPLSSFSVALDAQQETIHVDQQVWTLYPLAIQSEYAAALAVAKPAASISIWDFIDQKPVFRSTIKLTA